MKETSDASLFQLNQRRVSQEGTGRAVPGDTAVTRFANSDQSSVDPTVRLDFFKPSTTASGQPKVRDRGSQSFLGYRETSSSYPSESSEDGSFHELGGIDEEQSGPQQQAPAQEVQPPPPPPPSPPGQQIPPGDNGGGREPSENSQSSDSESGTSESSSSSSSSTSSSDDDMATVGGKYVTVPTFSAREGEDPDRWLERFEEAASYNIDIYQISVYEEQEDGSRRSRFQFNNVSADHRLLLKEMASKKMLETVELQEIGSCRKKKTSCLLDTGSDLTIVSPEWCEEMKAKVTPWEGPHLWMANATPADVIGMVEISVAN